jgi:photosystem II stability/assembly factor-like uncharacterized protein
MRRGFIAFLCTFFLRTFSQTQQNLPQAKNWAGFTSDYGGLHLTAAENNEPGPGHIYYSMNGGESWQISDAPDVSYYDIAGSSNGQFVIASGATSKTLYISRTEGKNWTIPITPRSNPISVALSSNGQYMAYTRNENEAACITMSPDYGFTWTTVGPTGVCGVLGISSSVNGTFIVVAVAGEGLYHSEDAGMTFTLQYPSQNIVFSKIVYAYQSVSIWYASMSTVPWQIITSLDNGLSWTSLNGTAQNSLVPITYLTVDASGANLLSVWGGDLYSSTNFGGFFRQINSFPSTSERCTLNGDGAFCLYNYGNSSWEYTNVYSADPSTVLQVSFFLSFFIFDIVGYLSYMPTRSPIFFPDNYTFTPSPVPSFKPTLAPTQEYCDQSACPTTCPNGYHALSKWSVEGLDCQVNCANEPSDGTCLPGGSGCKSSCALLPGVLTAIVLGTIIGAGILCYCIYIFWIKPLELNKKEAGIKTPLAEQEYYSSQATSLRASQANSSWRASMNLA